MNKDPDRPEPFESAWFASKNEPSDRQFADALAKMRARIRKTHGETDAARSLEEILLDPVIDGMVPGTSSWEQLPEYREEATRRRQLRQSALQADPDAWMTDAIRRGDRNQFRNALRRSVDLQSALNRALSLGREHMAADIIDAGADVGLASDERLPLVVTVEADQLVLTQLLLELGADPNTRLTRNGEPILVRAAILGRRRHMACLLDYGAALNAENAMGERAIHKALRNRDEKTVRMLLERGAEIDNGDSHLLNGVVKCALLGDHVACFELLEQFGWVPVEPFSDGMSALMLAAKAGAVAGVDWLLDRGVDVRMKSIQGLTALEYAEYGSFDRPSSSHQAIAKTLRDRLGERN